jgi:hypothetical protein
MDYCNHLSYMKLFCKSVWSWLDHAVLKSPSEKKLDTKIQDVHERIRDVFLGDFFFLGGDNRRCENMFYTFATVMRGYTQNTSTHYELWNVCKSIKQLSCSAQTKHLRVERHLLMTKIITNVRREHLHPPAVSLRNT